MIFRNLFATRRKIRRDGDEAVIIAFPPKFHTQLTEIFKFHKIPAATAEKLLARIDHSSKTIDAALEEALAATFKFEPLKFNLRKPIMVIGMPGIGKTLAISKMATEASFFNRKVNVITTDIKRAGGVEQLTTFTKLLGIELVICRNPDELEDQLAKNQSGITLIDTAGANPFDKIELELTREFLQVADIEPMLVLQAGGDAEEAIDIANAFKFANAKRLLITKADTARRLGGILSAVENNGLAFSNFGGTSNVGKGLEPITPAALASLILKPVQDNG